MEHGGIFCKYFIAQTFFPILPSLTISLESFRTYNFDADAVAGHVQRGSVIKQINIIEPIALIELFCIVFINLLKLKLFTITFQIYIASFGEEERLVVFNTQWLCYEIIGPTFAGDDFAGQLTKLPDKPFFTADELQHFYRKVADFHTLQVLLRSLDLMVEYAPDQFIIFAKLAELKSLPLKKMKHVYGICIFCDDRKTMFLPGLYPAIQARIMKKIQEEVNRIPLITQRALKFLKQEEGVIDLATNKEMIKVAVGTDSKDLTKCYQDLQRVAVIIESALIEVSPGTIIKRGKILF